MKKVMVLTVFFAILFFFYRSCTKGYEQYAYFVQAGDEAVFKMPLSADDSRIVDHGRKLTDSVLVMDREVDNGDGPDKGGLRWYVCSGIDCDEGWHRSFLP